MKRELCAMVAGHICLDITPYIQSNIQKPISEILVPGTLVTVSDVSLSLGGAVWNVGMALYKLGIPTILNGLVGTDEFGKIIERMIEKSGVECGLKKKTGSLTSFTVVLSVPSCDRIFLHAPGANNDYSSKDVDYAAIKNVDLFHFGYPPVMRNTYINEGAELLEMFKSAKATGVTTSLDMAMPDPFSESGYVDWELILKKVLPYADIFAPSIEEILFMIDREMYNLLKQNAAGKDMISVLDLNILSSVADKLHELGSKIIMLKCGHKGCYISTKNIDKYFGKSCPTDVKNWSNRKIFEPCFYVENIASTTGAGDTTIAGFLASLLRDTSIESALSHATAVGALCVSVKDTVSSIVPFNQVSELIDKGWKKV
ncbi:carbohydrate kinase family protein [Treponema sp.]